ncbi:MAG: hypothetical protein SGPRY_005376 [Prymnesium sp.]
MARPPCPTRRSKLNTRVHRSRSLAPGRVLVKPNSYFRSLNVAAALQADSTFCLCPSGDAPSFTQRLYVSILHGCIPVRVDTFLRYPADPVHVETAFPFPSLINWSRISLSISATQLLPIRSKLELARDGYPYLEREFHRLVPRLLDLEASGQARAMRAYMREVAPLLAFDSHDQTGRLNRQDAASAALYELALKIGKPLKYGR